MRLAREAYRRAELLEREGVADPDLVQFIRDCAHRLDELEHQLRDATRFQPIKRDDHAR